MVMTAICHWEFHIPQVHRRLSLLLLGCCPFTFDANLHPVYNFVFFLDSLTCCLIFIILDDMGDVGCPVHDFQDRGFLPLLDPCSRRAFL